jgi:hypothetical protein
MDISLTTATWLWLIIPMPLILVLSGISYFSEKERVNQHEY